jgi:hypothetical protein
VTAPGTDAVRDYLLTEHRNIVEAVRDCTVAAAEAETDDDRRSETTAVRRGTETRLREAGVWTTLPGVLAGCVRAFGRELSATPVPAPPYVAPTATGVVLRATVDGGRLVVSVDALTVERGGDSVGVRLAPRGDPLPELVDVEWRS